MENGIRLLMPVKYLLATLFTRCKMNLAQHHIRRLGRIFIEEARQATLDDEAVREINDELLSCVRDMRVPDTTVVDRDIRWGRNGSKEVAELFIFPILSEFRRDSDTLNKLFDIPTARSALYAVLHYNTSAREQLTEYQQRSPRLVLLLRENRPTRHANRPLLSKCGTCTGHHLQPPLARKRHRENEELGAEHGREGDDETDSGNDDTSYVSREYLDDTVHIEDDAETSSEESSGFENLDD
jgi:hypothetical protein